MSTATMVNGSEENLFDGANQRQSRPRQLRSSMSKMVSSISWTIKTASDGIQDWTPFVLVFCYFAFSICIYMVASSAVMKVFWFVYLFTNTYIAASTVIEAMFSVGKFHEAKAAAAKVEKNHWTFPTPDADMKNLDLCIVAYLPNEQDIILDRINYLLQEIVYPRDKLRIVVLYNTPTPIEPLETEMRAMMLKHPELRVIKVPKSKSKADNINYYCSLENDADVTAIFDCDHYPHPYNPRWAVENFQRDDQVDIVQGRCVIFNSDDTLLTAMISVEFDKIYAVSHPGRSTMFGFGLFCGSNGFWRTSLLRHLKMDETMLTEDIDSALRAFGVGAKVIHDLNVVSFELAPTTWPAFWKQRLRWSQGWLQASVRHIHKVWTRSPEGRKRTLTHRFGLLSLLYIRESSYYLVTQYLCLVAAIVIMRWPQSGEDLFKLVFFMYPVAWWLFMFSCISYVVTLWITFHTRSEFVRWWHIIVFTLTYPAQLILTAVMGLFGHARQVSKYVKWNPTPRS